MTDQATIYYGTGRRKEAIAKVWMKAGTGKYMVNGKDVLDVFTRIQHQNFVLGPLKVTNMLDKVDIHASTLGGGISGQAGAVRLGVARALVAIDENHRRALRAGGHLTRDPRMKERKKYGQPGARKRYQFSKR